MLTLIALMAQTATLPTGTFEAARTCAIATTIAHGAAKSPMRLTSQYTYYVMHATKADLGGKGYFERLQELAESTGSLDKPSDAVAKTLTPLCEARFPRPPIASTPKLPTDPFHRDVMCFGTLSVLQGAAQGLSESGGDAAPLAAIEKVLKPLLASLTDEKLKQKGVGDDGAFMKLLGDQMNASMRLGEPVTVAAACGVPGL
jgi:hypothetical protein